MNGGVGAGLKPARTLRFFAELIMGLLGYGGRANPHEEFTAMDAPWQKSHSLSIDAEIPLTIRLLPVVAIHGKGGDVYGRVSNLPPP